VTVSNGVIDSANFTLCLELLAWIGCVDLDESLQNAFEGGLLSTDWDSDQRYKLPLGKLEVSISRDEDGYVSFRVESDAENGEAVQLALYTAETYRLSS